MRKFFVAFFIFTSAAWADVVSYSGNTVVGPASSTNNAAAIFSGTNGKLLADSKLILTAPASAATLTLGSAKTVTISNTLTFSGTDGSTLAIGTGGTLGTAAFKNTGTTGNTIPLLDGTNTFSGVQTFTSTTIGISHAIFNLSEDSATGGPLVAFRRTSASPAVNDDIGLFIFQGYDSVAALTGYATLSGRILDPTNGSEDGAIILNTIVAGSAATRWQVGAGGYWLPGADATYDIGTLGTLRARSYYGSGLVQHGVTTVAGLPTCDATSEGSRYGVTDATASTFGAAPTGGGAVHGPVYCNGTAWVGG